MSKDLLRNSFSELREGDAVIVFRAAGENKKDQTFVIASIDTNEEVPTHVHAACAIFYHMLDMSNEEMDAIVSKYFAALDDFEETEESE